MKIFHDKIWVRWRRKLTGTTPPQLLLLNPWDGALIRLTSELWFSTEICIQNTFREYSNYRPDPVRQEVSKQTDIDNEMMREVWSEAEQCWFLRTAGLWLPSWRKWGVTTVSTQEFYYDICRPNGSMTFPQYYYPIIRLSITRSLA